MLIIVIKLSKIDSNKIAKMMVIRLRKVVAIDYKNNNNNTKGSNFDK